MLNASLNSCQIIHYGYFSDESTVLTYKSTANTAILLGCKGEQFTTLKAWSTSQHTAQQWPVVIAKAA